MALLKARHNCLEPSYLTERVRHHFNNLKDSKTLDFIDRVKITNTSDDEITGSIESYKVEVNEYLLTGDGGEHIQTKLEVPNAFSIPNIKIGSAVGKPMVARLNNQDRSEKEEGFIREWADELCKTLAIGLRQRLNSLVAGMMSGEATTGTPYIGIGFGIPKNLQIFTNWATSASKPLTEIRNLVQASANKYGMWYDRATLSTSIFRDIIRTDEFLKEVRTYSDKEREKLKSYDGEDKAAKLAELPVFSEEGDLLSYKGLDYFKHALADLVNLTIEINDSTFRQKDQSNQHSQQRYLPERIVVLSSSNLDNDGITADFGNGIVAESIVSDIIAAATGADKNHFGPIAYATAGVITDQKKKTETYDIRIWAVMRGFPRLHNKYAFATLSV